VGIFDLSPILPHKILWSEVG